MSEPKPKKAKTVAPAAAAGPAAAETQTAPTHSGVVQSTDDYQRLAATARADATFEGLLGNDDSVMLWLRRQIDEKTQKIYRVKETIRAAAAIHVAAGTRDQEEQLRYILTTEIIQHEKEIGEFWAQVLKLALAFAPSRKDVDDGWGIGRR